MKKQPLLQFYVDETWGYDIWDEESKKREGVKVKFQQKEDETREDFFKRLGFEPKPKMYGSDLEIDEKVRSGSWNARIAAAEQGYGLDFLVHDKDGLVRRTVAWQGYGLDILVHDKSWDVREVVAKRGYGLGVLVHDEEPVVRREVAQQSFGLDILVHDENCYVREAVAWQGFGLDILVHDEDEDVRGWAKYCLEEKGYPSIETWIEENPERCADKKNRL